MSEIETAYRSALEDRAQREAKLAEEAEFWQAFYRGSVPASVAARLEAQQAAIETLSAKIATLWDDLIREGLTLKAGTVIHAPVIKFRPKTED